MATSIVGYPQGTNFKMDYYVKTHMPLVLEKWGKHGLKGYSTIECDDESPYKVVTSLQWTDLDSYKKASGSPELQEIMDDVKNCADKQPFFASGSIVGSA